MCLVQSISKVSIYLEQPQNFITVVREFCTFDFSRSCERNQKDRNMNGLTKYESFFKEIIETINSTRYEAYKLLNKFHSKTICLSD